MTPRSKSESKRLAITGKQRPPTLREWKEFLKQVATGDIRYEVVDDEVTGIPDYIKAEAPIGLQKQANELLARLTDEGLELDEKRRELFKDSHNTLKAMISAYDHGWFVVGKYPPRAVLRIAREQIEAIAKLDALTPKEEKS